MLVKAVVFDLDGTLVNSLEDIANSMNMVLERHHFPTHSFVAYQQFIGHGIRDLVSKAIPDSHKNDNFISSFLKEMMEVYSMQCTKNTKMYAGISDLLDSLTAKEIPMVVFSNKVEVLTKKVVSEVLSDWTFYKTIGLTTEALKKPNPDKALQIAQKLGVASDEILFIGDSEADMQTANRAKMQPVGVLWGFRTKAQLLNSGAKYIIKEPMELMKIVEG
ncbi:phosphoglycolate phosphatase [Wenyingzhuangia heitensis]|uniref:phosphoglycolate phosphatase n=1 Tax=Wenyingzhuangia heitensis TaxID=1487859 RepID=A0ABX0UDJ4_9FLAO|nr:HAD family hydrolase [Wenyingzhuangia heitensis]NIJ45606.1 phosphoglycolate phosphatase [Wenyingzhuangia heitensis]